MNLSLTIIETLTSIATGMDLINENEKRRAQAAPATVSPAINATTAPGTFEQEPDPKGKLGQCR